MIKMNKYEFNVKIFGRMTLEVIANSKEEAERMVKDLMDNINIKDIELKENNINDIKINKSEVNTTIEDKNKERER